MLNILLVHQSLTQLYLNKQLHKVYLVLLKVQIILYKFVVLPSFVVEQNVLQKHMVTLYVQLNVQNL
ncbi:Uncharacterised protein [Mycobacteroides abscessus subsp. massiliense]|nr:Uncharacterised protein [Mycobacteroides abscessus subsp. massiliense]